MYFIVLNLIIDVPVCLSRYQVSLRGPWRQGQIALTFGMVPDMEGKLSGGGKIIFWLEPSLWVELWQMRKQSDYRGPWIPNCCFGQIENHLHSVLPFYPDPIRDEIFSILFSSSINSFSILCVFTLVYFWTIETTCSSLDICCCLFHIFSFAWSAFSPSSIWQNLFIL